MLDLACNVKPSVRPPDAAPVPFTLFMFGRNVVKSLCVWKGAAKMARLTDIGGSISLG